MSEQLEWGSFSPDVCEFLKLLDVHRVDYLIVGGEAVIFHGYPRLTGDVDFFYGLDPENGRKLFEALKEFWGDSIPGVARVEDLLDPGVVIQFGRPPYRIDLLNTIDGVTFSEAWNGRRTVSMDEIPVHYIGLKELRRNKEASGRHKDLDDLEHLP